MTNPSTPYFAIWRLFIDGSRTKINVFYEIDDINILGAGALYQITRRLGDCNNISILAFRMIVANYIIIN
jgi:hypothetical protein